MLDNLNKYNVVLASKSPRRQELLRGIGVDFVVFTKEVDESYPDATPLRDVAPLLSLKKAKAFEDEELPENCRKYIEFIEEQIGYPITMVSNGPGRSDIIYRESPLKK